MNPAEIEKKVEYTTFRIFAAEGGELSRLASLRGQAIADTYRDLCGDIVRQALRMELQRAAAELGESGA